MTETSPETGSAGATYNERSAAELAVDLLLDRIDALRVLRADTPEEKGALLEEIAGPGRPGQDIVSQLSKARPLYRPGRFMEAHRLAMRSLEVLDRNGNRPATFRRRLGPLLPVASYVVGLMTRFIVKEYQNSTIETIRKLYERREANAQWGTPEHSMVRQARTTAPAATSALGSASGDHRHNAERPPPDPDQPTLSRPPQWADTLANRVRRPSPAISEEESEHSPLPWGCFRIPRCGHQRSPLQGHTGFLWQAAHWIGQRPGRSQRPGGLRSRPAQRPPTVDRSLGSPVRR